MNGNTEVLEVLRGMWGEMKTVSARINTTNERLDRLGADLNARIDETNERLDRGLSDLGARIDETNERLDRGLSDLGARIDETNRRLEIGFGHLTRRIDNVLVGGHRDEHAELRDRVGRIEEHVGLAPAPPSKL